MSEELNITPGKQEELWKFGDDSYKNIYEMEIVEVFTCAIYALKRIRHWHKQARFYQYKIEVTYDDQKKEDNYHYQKTRCNDNVYLFSTKLKALEEQSNLLGFELPEEFEEVKAKLSVLKKAEKVSDEVES